MSGCIPDNIPIKRKRTHKRGKRLIYKWMAQGIDEYLLDVIENGEYLSNPKTGMPLQDENGDPIRGKMRTSMLAIIMQRMGVIRDQIKNRDTALMTKSSVQVSNFQFDPQTKAG